MKPEATNHEVLLFTSTHFPKNHFCKKNCHKAGSCFLAQLKSGYRNGLIVQILTRIIKYPLQKDPVQAWEVIPAENFIEVKIGTGNPVSKKEISVNPYFFLSTKNFN